MPSAHYGFVAQLKFVPSWVFHLPNAQSLRRPGQPTHPTRPTKGPDVNSILCGHFLEMSGLAQAWNGPVTFFSGNPHALSSRSQPRLCLVLFPRGLVAFVISWSKCLSPRMLSLKFPPRWLLHNSEGTDSISSTHRYWGFVSWKYQLFHSLPHKFQSLRFPNTVGLCQLSKSVLCLGSSSLFCVT